MAKIGFLFGNEQNFSNAVINRINEQKLNNIIANPVTIGILTEDTPSDYAVILDRFAPAVPFYKTAMSFFEKNGTKIINSANSNIEEEFNYLTLLSKNGVRVPKTAIFPSKTLPQGVQGHDMHNLEYPLNWDKMFKYIGFPANVKANNSNALYDCYRVFNKQDFYFIYDQSATNTLVLQQCIDTPDTFRLFVVGNKKILLRYELHKAPKDRYSVADYKLDDKTNAKIDAIIKKVKTQYSLDMFVMDIAIAKKLYLLNINPFNTNIDNAKLPEECYAWLVNETANLLIKTALENKNIVVKEVKEKSKKAAKEDKPLKEKAEKKVRVKKEKVVTEASSNNTGEKKRGRPRKNPIV
jgi:hypothetical protein